MNFYVDKASGKPRMVESVPALDVDTVTGTIDLLDYLDKENCSTCSSHLTENHEKTSSWDDISRIKLYICHVVAFMECLHFAAPL